MNPPSICNYKSMKVILVTQQQQSIATWKLIYVDKESELVYQYGNKLDEEAIRFYPLLLSAKLPELSMLFGV